MENDVIVSHLEMLSLKDLIPGSIPKNVVELVLQDESALEEIKSTYFRVGEQYNWTARDSWTLREWELYCFGSQHQDWLIAVDDEVAGLLDLEIQSEGNVEIRAFGLLPEYLGKELGGHALTLGIEKAWGCKHADHTNTMRVHLKTCSQDHANALPNYLARGFKIYKSAVRQKDVEKKHSSSNGTCDSTEVD